MHMQRINIADMQRAVKNLSDSLYYNTFRTEKIFIRGKKVSETQTESGYSMLTF